MNKNLATLITIHIIMITSALINRVYAAEESLISKFLGSPLLILTAIIVIDITAYLYRKIRG